MSTAAQSTPLARVDARPVTAATPTAVLTVIPNVTSMPAWVCAATTPESYRR